MTVSARPTRPLVPLIALITLLFTSIGCSAHKEVRSEAVSRPGVMAMADIEAGESARPEAGAESIDRMIAKTARLEIEVDSLQEIEGQVKKIVTDAGGHVTDSSFDGERHFRATLKVPSQDLEKILDTIAQLGSEQSRSIQTEDVTDEYIDVKARLDNLTALRDRLRALLDKATEVKDILSIEVQLARVQGQLDSLQGRLNALKGRTNFSTIYLTAKAKRIYGPLGYIGMGIWWVIEKLFVIK